MREEKKGLLIVEDDFALRRQLKQALEAEYRVYPAADAGEALFLLKKGGVHICLLDVNLPKEDGFAFCRRIRTQSDMPVLFLSAMDGERDIIQGLECGGDDYIAKPFKLNELKSRLRAHLNRFHRLTEKRGEDLQQADYMVGELVLDCKNFRLCKPDRQIAVTDTEKQILEILMERPGCLVKRHILLERIWDGTGNFIEDNTLSVHVSRLRKKMKELGEEEFIQTVSGIGYRFVSR